MATGAELSDLDIISQPLTTSTEFQNRISTWIEEVDEHEGGRDKALVGFFGQVKKNVIDSGKDFQKLVEGSCKRYIYRCYGKNELMIDLESLLFREVLYGML